MMYKLERVLAATDGTQYGACAVFTAGDLARRAGARLHVVSVAKPSLSTIYDRRGRHLEDRDAGLQKARRAAEAQARLAKAVDPTFHIIAGAPAPTIASMASKISADVIVVGAHPRPRLQRLLAVSTAEREVRMAPCPVLVATCKQRTPFRRVLAAVDLSPLARRVISTAGAIARIDGADFRILHVNEPIPPLLMETAENEVDALTRASHAILKGAIWANDGFLPSFEVLERDGYAGSEILREAYAWRANLVVVGSLGLGVFGRMVLGSTSVYVLRHGQIPTIIVPDKLARSQSIQFGSRDVA